MTETAVTSPRRAGALSGGAGRGVDFAAFAQAAGWPGVARYEDLTAWRREVSAALALPGPRMIVLDVAPVGADYHLEIPGPLPPRLAAFRAALAASGTRAGNGPE